MVRRWLGQTVAGAACLLLAGCPAPEIKQVEQPRVLTAAPLGTSTEPIALARVISSIPRGTLIGGYSYGPGCEAASAETWSADYGDLRPRGFNAQFFEVLSGAGYRVAGDPRRMFDVEDERASARYLVGAEISEVQLSLCYHREFWSLTFYGPRGDGYIKVNWQVYSVRDRRVVYEVTTEGNGRTTHGTRDGVFVLIQRSFAGAAANLAADPRFREIVSGGDSGAVSVAAAAPAGAAVEIPRFATSTRPVNPRLQEVRHAAVTVMNASAHGSGFFVSDEGHLLTNQHVVGDAESVNVRLLSGVEVAGRVLRRDPVRDVALVKVDLQRTRPLPVRQEAARIGEEVYAIGSPIQVDLAGSVTRGVVSAIRREDRGGVELDMIQSDAAIQGGNSGGPLLDTNGNVIGIAVSGWGVRRMNAGLNFFIPIHDALERLNIRLGGPRELRF